MQLLQQTDNVVIATGRSFSKAKALEELQSKHPKRLHLITMDVVDASSIQASAAVTLLSQARRSSLTLCEQSTALTIYVLSTLVALQCFRA